MPYWVSEVPDMALILGGVSRTLVLTPSLRQFCEHVAQQPTSTQGNILETIRQILSQKPGFRTIKAINQSENIVTYL